MNSSSLRIALVGNLLGAAGAVGMAVSAILLTQDATNRVPFEATHIMGLALSVVVATLGGLLNRAHTPWFAWLSYGALLPSGGVALVVLVAHVRTLTPVKNDLGVFTVALFVFAVSLPATLIARQRARSRLALVQSFHKTDAD